MPLLMSPFVTCLLLTLGIIKNDENEIKLDFRIGHVLVIFLFLWIVNEKCKINHEGPLPNPEIDMVSQYICHNILFSLTPMIIIMSTFRNNSNPL